MFCSSLCYVLAHKQSLCFFFLLLLKICHVFLLFLCFIALYFRYLFFFPLRIFAEEIFLSVLLRKEYLMFLFLGCSLGCSRTSMSVNEAHNNLCVEYNPGSLLRKLKVTSFINSSLPT
jgi:hypothetical protein